MKIGIIYSPSAAVIDIAELLQTFSLSNQLFSDQDLHVEICSFLPPETQETGITINPGLVGSSLTGFDILVFPGSAGYESLKTDNDWLTWIKDTQPGTQYFAFHEGKNVLDFLKTPNQWKLNNHNLMNGFLVGFQILSPVLSPQDLLKIIKSLGMESAWQSYLQRINFRQASLSRETAETNISINLSIDGTGKSIINTGIPFLDHMLNQIAKHGLFDIELSAQGDLEIDAHHTMEDCGIILGDAFRQALGEKKGINRMASATVPMDESLVTVSIDFSGRPYCVIQSNWNGENIAEIPISLFEHFLESFAIAARCNLFVQVQSGKDNHHMCEATFKALARALNQACSLDLRRVGQIPSTKERIF